MNRTTLRLLVILATLCIVGISITQLYWVRRAFDLKEDALNREINNALFIVTQQLFEVNEVPMPAHNPVQQVSSNYFVVNLNTELDAHLLEFLLKTELERRNIKFDFEYGVYNCATEQLVYGGYVPIEAKSIEKKGNLPPWREHTNYFGVQFPTRGAHLLNSMGIWIFSTLVMLLVIVFFASSLFIIFKQRRLSEIQKDFINNMTHEFKTPISTIALSAEVLKSPDTSHQPERLLSYATIIQNENNRLRQQVDRVLQVARLDKESVSLKHEPLDLKELVTEAMHRFEPLAKEKGGQLVLTMASEILPVSGDKLHIANAINNLLDNALKYVEKAPHIEISLTLINQKSGVFSSKSNKNHICIQVKDNGIGIAPEHQKKVFTQFYRVPTGNLHNVKGFGIGLHYVKLIAEAHGGTVAVSSTPGHGSTFSITLPVA